MWLGAVRCLQFVQEPSVDGELVFGEPPTDVRHVVQGVVDAVPGGILGGGRGREDPGGHEGYGEDRVVADIQLDGAVGRVTFDRIVGEGECRAGVAVHGEPHVGAALVVMDDIGGDVVDGAVGRAALLGEDAADDGDGVTERSIDVEAEDNRNPGFDVRQDVAVDVPSHGNKGADSRLH